MNRPEAIRVLKPFLDRVLSIRNEPLAAIPIILELALMGTSAGPSDGQIKGRIHRRYVRMCRLQEELGRLDFKKAKPGVSAEDFIFSRIDFSVYRELEEKNFHTLFTDGITDFSEEFYRKNLNAGREEVKSLISNCYKKTDGKYRLQRENPMILSVMRTLETSLEESPLLTEEEIHEELKKLPGIAARSSGLIFKKIPAASMLYPLLVKSLDNTLIQHDDGMETKLFITEAGELAGIFRPGGKPWTRVLIPAEPRFLSP